jgi:hypothetical protein
MGEEYLMDPSMSVSLVFSPRRLAPLRDKGSLLHSGGNQLLLLILLLFLLWLFLLSLFLLLLLFLGLVFAGLVTPLPLPSHVRWYTSQESKDCSCVTPWGHSQVMSPTPTLRRDFTFNSYDAYFIGECPLRFLSLELYPWAFFPVPSAPGL